MSVSVRSGGKSVVDTGVDSRVVRVEFSDDNVVDSLSEYFREVVVVDNLLEDGPHDFPGLLIDPLIIPARIESR